MNINSVTPKLPYTPTMTLNLSRDESLKSEVEQFLANGGKVKVLDGFKNKAAKPIVPIIEEKKAKPKGSAVARYKLLTAEQSEEIKELLRKKGVAKVKVARAIGVISDAWISNVVNHTYSANPEKLKLLLGYLHSLPDRGEA